MNGYALSKKWFEFAKENPDLIRPNDTALYLWLIEKNNSCNWVEKFSITSTENMSACGFQTYPPYKKAFDKLVDLGFVKVITKSSNQYQANIIALSKSVKTSLKQSLQQPICSIEKQHSNSESTFDINKPINNKTINMVQQDFLSTATSDKFNFEKALISYGFDKQLVLDWKRVRSKKKAIDTETAYKTFIKEVEKCEQDKNEILEIVVTKGWKTFKPEWLENIITTRSKSGFTGTDI